jgi:glycosyltransferase involved in cell wall biosynthesis
MYQGVRYRHHQDLVRAAAEERFSVLVVSRFSAAFTLPLQAGLRVLWNHDILDKPAALQEHLDQVDICLVLSRFHAWDYSQRLPECGPKLVTTRNGLDLPLLAKASQGVSRQPLKATYVSRPERGLKLLLEDIWPRLRAEIEDLELEICGYQVSQTEIHPKIKREYEYIDKLIAHSPGVEVLGALAKADYYRHLASCQCVLYPCVFPEISCIAALEAQSVGTPMVTSDEFALRETVLTPQFRIPGRPGSSEYIQAYVEQALEVFRRPQEALDLAAQARDQIWKRYDWDLIAAEWEALFRQRLEQRIQSQALEVAASLLLNGDRQAAQSLVQRPLTVPPEGPAPEDPEEGGLLDHLAATVKDALAERAETARVGVMSADQGRTAQALAGRLQGVQVEELEDSDPPQARYDLVLIRDRLEREARPQELLSRALAWCSPQGWLALCVASGAWPLIRPGHLGRLHDLGRRELERLLPRRRLKLDYLPRGLVGCGPVRYFAGRWLALAPATGPQPMPLKLESKLWQAQPAPAEVLKEVQHAGLV